MEWQTIVKSSRLPSLSPDLSNRSSQGFGGMRSGYLHLTEMKERRGDCAIKVKGAEVACNNGIRIGLRSKLVISTLTSKVTEATLGAYGSLLAG